MRRHFRATALASLMLVSAAMAEPPAEPTWYALKCDQPGPSPQAEVDAIVHVDWSALAAKALPSWHLSHPTAKEVRLLLGRLDDYGTAYLPFTAPLPASIQEWHFVLVNPERVAELIPKKLAGSIAFRLDPDGGPKDNPGARIASGHLEFQPVRPESTVGLLLASKTPLKLTRVAHTPASPRIVVHGSGKTTTLSFPDAPEAKPMALPADLQNLPPALVGKLVVKSAVRVEAAGLPRLVVVEWDPGACGDLCAGAIDVFQLDPVPHLLEWIRGPGDP